MHQGRAQTELRPEVLHARYEDLFLGEIEIPESVMKQLVERFGLFGHGAFLRFVFTGKPAHTPIVAPSNRPFVLRAEHEESGPRGYSWLCGPPGCVKRHLRVRFTCRRRSA
jgi:hypothetical protein